MRRYLLQILFGQLFTWPTDQPRHATGASSYPVESNSPPYSLHGILKRSFAKGANNDRGTIKPSNRPQAAPAPRAPNKTFSSATSSPTSHPNPSHPNPSHPNPSHPNPSHPNPSHPNPSHPTRLPTSPPKEFH